MLVGNEAVLGLRDVILLCALDKVVTDREHLLSENEGLTLLLLEEEQVLEGALTFLVLEVFPQVDFA